MYFEDLDKMYDEDLLSEREDKTIDELENVFKEDNNDFENIKLIIHYYIYQKDIEKIIYYANKLFEVSNGMLNINFMFMLLLKENSEYVNVFKKYDYPFIYEILGEYYDRKNDKEKAFEYFLKGAEKKSYLSLRWITEYFSEFSYSKEISKNAEKVVYCVETCYEMYEKYVVEEKTVSVISPVYLIYLYDSLNKTSLETRKIIDDAICKTKMLSFHLSEICKNEKKDEMLFLYYCQSSASNGFWEANVLLSKYYLNKDLKKAQYYSKKAYELKMCSLTHECVREVVKEIVSKKKVSLLDTQAFSIINDDEWLLCDLAEYYVSKDLKKAQYFLQRACELNDDYKKHECVRKVVKKIISEKKIGLLNTQAFNIINESADLLYDLAQYYYFKGDRTNALNYCERAYKIDDSIKSINELMCYLTSTPFDIKDEIDSFINMYKEFDNRTKIMLEKIKNGAQIIEIMHPKDLMTIDIESIPSGSIVYLRPYDFEDEIGYNLYNSFEIIKIIRIIKKILDNIDLSQNEEDIFMQIYIKLGLMLSYDFKAAKDEEQEIQKKYSSRNLMMLISKKGVCAGYARVLQIILSIVGIDSLYVVSKIKKELDDDGNLKEDCHAFNQVKLNGKWYYCDLTWDSLFIKINLPLFYCLKPSDIFCKDEEYHQARYNTKVNEVDESYNDLTLLYLKNKYKLFMRRKVNNFMYLIDEKGGKFK